MDNLTHSLVGLASAKAGLERLSPYATTVCIVSANAPDVDFVSVFFGDRWTLLQHHRGITHSIVGTVVLALAIPSLAFLIELIVAKIRKVPSQIRFRGLLIASSITAATHPLMDWTNNYGIRPLLPWNEKWFYGDLVFIADPYIWLVLGGAVFLLTSNRPLKTIAWSALGVCVTALIIMASLSRAADGSALRVGRAVWIAGIVLLLATRSLGLHKRIGRKIAIAALAIVVCYWAALAWAHHAAYADASAVANEVAARRGELVIRAAAMPTLANPFRWQCVAETDRATYRFTVSMRAEMRSNAVTTAVERYEKPTGRDAQLVSLAENDRRARIFLGFARFPGARLADADCVGQTLVQFADLRYTEPGAARGTFSVNIPVDCPAR